MKYILIFQTLAIIFLWYRVGDYRQSHHLRIRKLEQGIENIKELASKQGNDLAGKIISQISHFL